MTAKDEGIKRVTLRWPMEFWETVAIEAKKRRTSVQAISIEAIAKKLRIAVPEKETAA